tara:strand:- start:903 stop:1274 length:372 start_codon:yes stop_codon:yes gene_type:complete
MELKQIAFSIVMLGFILNMSLSAVAYSGLGDVIGVDVLPDTASTDAIDEKARQVELATNSFESFLANIQLVSVFTGIYDFIFIWPKTLAALPGMPNWIVGVLGYPLVIIWLAGLVYLISGRAI